MKFFFDSASTSAITKNWHVLKDKVSPDCVTGITTNPKAMAKIEAFSYDSWIVTTKALLALLNSIRNDTEGYVYIQFPDTTKSAATFLKFVSKVKSDLGDHLSLSKLGFKIPPYPTFLNELSNLLTEEEFIDLNLNVTGVADHCTALNCLRYPVRFVSIIPGRMNEKGIDSDEVTSYISSVGAELFDDRVITGAMRDIPCLESMVRHRTVPTIGMTVFETLITNSTENVDRFVDMWKKPQIDYVEYQVPPVITSVNQNLSLDFFVEMNNQCPSVYED